MEEWKQQLVVLQVQGIEKVLELDLSLIQTVSTSVQVNLWFLISSFLKAESNFLKYAETCKMHVLKKVRASLFKIKSVTLSITSMGVALSPTSCILLSFLICH